MKNMILSLILIFSTYMANAQITLENSYAYSTSVSEVNDEDYFFYLMDVALSQCRIYTKNHELQKTIDLSIPEGYYLSDIKFVGKGIFNSDDLIELLYIYEKYVSTDAGSYYQYGLSVVNEDGTTLLLLPNGGWAEVKNVANENKLLAYLYTYNPEGYYMVMTNVYTLEGSATMNSFSAIEQSLAYPNPTSEYISIETSQFPDLKEGEFILFNASGTKVYSAEIQGNQIFTMPVNQFPSGSYFYSIRNGKKLLGTNKIIIR